MTKSFENLLLTTVRQNSYDEKQKRIRLESEVWSHIKGKPTFNKIQVKGDKKKYWWKCNNIWRVWWMDPSGHGRPQDGRTWVWNWVWNRNCQWKVCFSKIEHQKIHKVFCGRNTE